MSSENKAQKQAVALDENKTQIIIHCETTLNLQIPKQLS